MDTKTWNVVTTMFLLTLIGRDAGAKLGQGGLDLKKGTYDHDIN